MLKHVRLRAGNVSYATEESSRRALIEICAFVFFLCITTYIAVSLQTIYSFYFNRTIDRLFVKRDLVQMDIKLKFEDVATIEEFWSFLLEDFFQRLDSNWRLSNRSALDVSLREIEQRKLQERRKRLFLGQNLVLEAPRLRQIRVKPHKCFKHRVFKDFYKNCYGPYTKDNEDQTPEFKGTKFYQLQNSGVMPFWGNLERYYGAGYVFALTYNQDKNAELARKLKEQDWIDRASRLVMIEMVIYNNNMDLFNNIKFVAELMPVGGIVSYSHMEVAPLFSSWSIKTPGMLATNVIFYLFIIFNTGNEIAEIWQDGLRNYMKSVWNYIDWCIVLVAYFSLVLSILHGYFIEEYLKDVFENRYEKLSSIDKTCHWFSIYVASMAVVAFLVWIRIFRFIGFNKTLLAFYMALKQCAQDILGFAIILFIVFMGFALLGLALFGTSDLDFCTFQYAYFFMIRLMLHDFEYTNFERSDDLWGELYFMSFIVVVIFLCFNMFLAIISQTYINVKNADFDTQSSIKIVMVKLYKRVLKCCMKMRQKLSTQPRSTPPMASQDNLYDEPGARPADDHVQKKIKFQDSFIDDGENESVGQQTVSSAGTRASRISPKVLNEDEALKEYFGPRRSSATSGTLKRSISQFSTSTFATPESSIGESLGDEDDDDDEVLNENDENITTESEEDRFSGTRERILKLQVNMAELTKDMTHILQKLLELERLKRTSRE